MGSQDADGRDSRPRGTLESAETQHDPATEIAVARTVESAEMVPPGMTVASLARAGDLPPGTMVGEYRVEGKLGAGGMGVVFAAVHPVIGKKAAVKVLKAEMCASAAGVERFVQEARAVNQIGHPNIVDVFSFGTLPDGRSYFVMEWLRGESLQARIKRQPLEVAETLDILEAVCAALAAAHDKGIIHRDLKPENVFLVEVKGQPPLVKLLDFGIAKLTGSEDTRMEKTATGHLLGTPLYMSPEQARGQAVDARADIYSLGAMAFEMLSGRPPFVAESAMDVVARHLNDPPPRLGELAPGVPASLARLIDRMLAKERGDRPSLAEVRAGLAAARDEEAPAAAAAAAPRSSRVPLLLGLLVAAAAAALAVWWFGRGGGGDPGKPAVSSAGPAPAPPPTRVIATTPADAGVAVAPPADAAPAGQRLVVTLTERPPGTRLWVDGKQVALADGDTLIELARPGEHEWKIEAPGYQRRSHRELVRAGEAVLVTVTLTRSGHRPPRPPPDAGHPLPPPPPPPDPDSIANPFKDKKPK